MDPYIASIMLFAGNFAPRNYMLCWGQLLPISQYSALFSLLGTTYGGNGTTTFALPDLRGRAAIGQGQGPGLSLISLGEMAGTESVSLQSTNMPAHTHAATVTINCVNDGRPNNDTPAGQALDSGSTVSLFSGATPDTPMAAGMATAQVGTAGGSQPISIQDPYLGLNYCIAVQGIFPSRN
jgi:microcystin-dependent protein